jgi:hypothetical protein
MKHDDSPFVLPDQNPDSGPIVPEITGNVTTFAGKAVYPGDDGPLKDAGITLSLGIAFDKSGVLYISD